MTKATDVGATIRILVIDDHPVVREGLVAILGAEPGLEIVGEAESAEGARGLIAERRPDVTLLDVRLPGMNGVELVEAVRRDDPDARFVMLTTYDDDHQMVRAFDAGVMAYLMKSMPSAQIVAALRAAHAGQRLIPPEIARRLADRLFHPLFTPKELDVLRLLAAGGSNKELAATLGVSPGTVKTHLASIFRKLGVGDRTTAVSAALKRGLVRID